MTKVSASLCGRGQEESSTVDPEHHQAWSVLVRGTLEHLDAVAVELLRDGIEPRPWVGERESWLVLRPIAITGRRLHAPEVEWVFNACAYL